jgi:hypothetical protein
MIGVCMTISDRFSKVLLGKLNEDDKKKTNPSLPVNDLDKLQKSQMS